MKVKPGDIVQYDQEVALDSGFLKQWGRGPFIVACVQPRINLTNMDGILVINPAWGDQAWSHTEDLLIKNVFLSSAKDAITKETNAKTKARNRKSKAKPAARRGRAA